MKKFAAILATAASLFSGASMAQGYVSIAGGTSRVNLDCSGLSNCDKTGTAIKLVGGYSFGNGLSAEIGYLDFGKAKVASGGVTAEAKAAGPTLGLAYTAPIGTDFAAVLRAGVAGIKTKLTGSVAGLGSASDSETNAAAYVGVGLNYAISKAVKVELGFDASRVEFDGEKGNVRAVTVGLRFDF